MADPVNVSGEMFQAGRADVRQVDPYRAKLAFNADFSTASSYSFDFSAVRSNQTFTIAKTMFIDNGSNPSEVEVHVSQTDQFFTIPPNAQGYFPIIATEGSYITITTNGGSADIATVVFFNYEMAGLVWYKFGTFNTSKPILVEGAMNEGDTIAAQTANNPVYIGGKDYATGLFRSVSVDANGFLSINNAASVLGSVNIKSAGAVDWFFTNQTTDAMPAQGTSNTPAINAVNRIYNGASFSRQFQVIAAQNTTGTGIQAVGLTAQLDDVTPTTITEGNFGNMRIAADRSLLVAQRSATGANSTVAGTVTASTSAIAANTNRKGATIFNDNADDSGVYLYISMGATCTTTSFNYRLLPGGTWEMPFGYVGIVTITFSAATGNARIGELI